MPKKILFLQFFLLLIVGAACTAQQTQAIPKNAFLVDVRTPQEFAQGSVPGAVNIPLNEVPNRIAEFKGKDTVVVFCRSGSRSASAKNILDQNGIKNVINGGTWQQVNSTKHLSK
jgi:phage shock protein E